MTNSWMPLLSPSFSVKMPASGDMWMDYKPWTNWGVSSTKVGSPEIESGIFRDVALPGKQLGRLTDAVAALIEIIQEAHPDAITETSGHAPAIEALTEMRNDILLKKAELKKTLEADASEALNRLKRADFAAFKSLVDVLHAQTADTAASDRD